MNNVRLHRSRRRSSAAEAARIERHFRNSTRSGRARRIATRGVAGLVAAAGIAIACSSAAFAATPATHVAASAQTGSPVGSPMLSDGFYLYNYSGETLNFDHVDGSMPAPPIQPLLPGMRANFELPYKFAHDSSGDAYYDVMSPSGAQVANLKLSFNNGGGGTYSWSITNETGGNFTVSNGNSTTNIYFEDKAGSPTTQQTQMPGSTQEQQSINNLCETGTAKCSFTMTGQTDGFTDPVLLASGYNGVSGVSQLSANQTYTVSATDTWGVSVTVNGTIAGIVGVAVQGTYSHSFATTQAYGTQWTTPVDSGDTGFIWGQMPMYEDTGTWTAHLGNTTFVIPGVDYANPIPHGAIHYLTSEEAGNVSVPPPPPANQILPTNGPGAAQVTAV